MKRFLAGTLFGIFLSALAATGWLYKIGKLDRAVEQVRETVVEPVKVALAPKPPNQDFKVAEPNPKDPEPVQLGIGAVINKPLFTPPDNPWNQDISKAPVDPMSARIIARIGADRPLHPEFGTFYKGAPNGVPYVVVGGDQKKVPVRFEYADESDLEPYPIPPDVPIEGGPNGTGDRHALILDRDNWRLYELFKLYPQPDGTYQAVSGAIFDLKSNQLRPAGWTSADAAGLPILPGLVRYDETMIQKEIKHALRFTVEKTRMAYVPPATHFASPERIRAEDYPPMGMRVRLRADYDISGFPIEAQVVLKCLKTYGMILADNGGAWFITGAPDPRWNDLNTHTLKKVKGRDLEVIQMKDMHVE
jgi:hypothetical protein